MNRDRPSSKHPIPPHAKKVFQGRIFSLFQWEQKMFDGTKEVFEKAKRADTVSVIPVTAAGEIVLTKQQQPGHQSFIGTAGGRIDNHESPFDAARRELREETGFESKSISLWFATQPMTMLEWSIFVFIAKDCTQTGSTQLDSGEKITLFPVDFDKFLTVVQQDDFRDLEITIRVLRELQKSTGRDTLEKIFFSENP